MSEFRSRHSPATEAVGYGKALMLFHMTRRQIGDEAFKRGLQKFYREQRGKRATFMDLARAYLQRASQQAPSGEIYGLLARNGEDIRAPGTWATVVSYEAIGYVQPETASGLSDTNFETQVRDARQTQSRRFEGFATAPSLWDPLPPSSPSTK